MKVNTKKLTLTALFSAFSLIAFMVEGLMPPLFIPGARLGLSNFFILTALYLLGVKEAIIVFLVKIILGSVFAGNLSGILYSLPSGIISLALEIFLIKKLKVSLLSASALGGVIHNIIQNAVFVLITKTPSLFSYLPYLSVLGLIAGAFVGILSVLIINLIYKNKTLDKFFMLEN